MALLNGIAWNHPRGYQPLIAASKEFTEIHPTISIKWDVRSLKEFGDMPIEELIESYDLITINHPYMGQADDKGLLLKLEEYISKEEIRIVREKSIGACFDSYVYGGHLYALPIDAAAQVAAYRRDILSEFGLIVTTTHKDLKACYSKVPAGLAVVWALCPTDLWCLFLTLCAQNSGVGFIGNIIFNKDVGSNVLDEIKHHLDFLHPESIYWNPIQVLDHMGKYDEIIYCPFLFGYTNYARNGYCKNRIDFTQSPEGEQDNISTLLGGVGLAASASTKYPDASSIFIAFVASDEIQKSIYTHNAGQPANLEAWLDKNYNRMCNNFFNDTISSIEKAYVRPRHPGWTDFQDKGAQILHEGVLRNRPSDEIIHELNERYQCVG